MFQEKRTPSHRLALRSRIDAGARCIARQERLVTVLECNGAPEALLASAHRLLTTLHRSQRVLMQCYLLDLQCGAGGGARPEPRSLLRLEAQFGGSWVTLSGSVGGKHLAHWFEPGQSTSLCGMRNRYDRVTIQSASSHCRNCLRQLQVRRQADRAP